MDSPKGAITEPRNRALQKVGILKMDSPEGATTEPRNRAFQEVTLPALGYMGGYWSVSGNKYLILAVIGKILRPKVVIQISDKSK